MSDRLPPELSDPPAGAADGDPIAAALAAAGLDQIWPFDPAWLADDTRAALGADDGRALLVATSRALWRPLLRFAAAELARDGRVGADPLQRYVERHVARALATAGAPPGARAIFSHHGPPFVPMQRVAAESGFGWLSPAMLVVHRTLGPWVALRAVIVGVGGATPDRPPPPAPPCPSCETACVPAFARAQGSADWRDWLAARDACPTGRTWRYSDAQLRYHYTKDLQVLVDDAARHAG